MLVRRPWILLGLALLATACSDSLSPRDPRLTPPEPAAAAGPRFLQSPWATSTVPQFQAQGAASEVLLGGGLDAGCNSDGNCTVVPPQVDAASSATTSGSTLNWSHTVGTGANRLLTVSVSIRNADNTVQSVNFAGRPLTFYGARNNHDGAVRVELWYLNAPPSGTGTVTVTLSGGAKMVGGAMSFAGVDPMAPLRGLNASGSTDTGTNNPSARDSSGANELAVSVVATDGNSTKSLAPVAGQTRGYTLSFGSSGGDVVGAGSTAPGAASLVMGWTKDKASKWAMLAFAVKPFVPAGLSLTTYQATFWAVRGQSRNLQINYAANGGTAPFMRLTVTDPTYVPGRGNLAVGDSVLITATVDPSFIVVDLQPNGVQFGTSAQLKIWYGGAGGDLNGDGVVNATDASIEQSLLSMWFRQDATQPWTLFAATKNLTEKSFTAALQHFSGYGVAW